MARLILIKLQDNEHHVCTVRGVAHKISAADFGTIKANDSCELWGYGGLNTGTGRHEWLG